MYLMKENKIIINKSITNAYLVMTNTVIGNDSGEGMSTEARWSRRDTRKWMSKNYQAGGGSWFLPTGCYQRSYVSMYIILCWE